MSYAFTRDVPVSQHHYAEVRTAIGAAVPEGDCGGNPAEIAARKRIAQARAWQWWAELRGDLCEHRSATAALQRACDELRQARTIAPASQQRP